MGKQFCTGCGAALTGCMKFCEQCGAPVGQEVPASLTPAKTYVQIPFNRNDVGVWRLG